MMFGLGVDNVLMLDQATDFHVSHQGPLKNFWQIDFDVQKLVDVNQLDLTTV